MLSKIIVGVDESESAYSAASRAAELAVALDADLWLVSAYGKREAEKLDLGGEEYLLSNEQSASGLLNSVKQRLREHAPEVRVNTSAEEGRPADALVNLEKRIDADLIVVGNRRVQGPMRVFGSIARDVAARTSCDLYVVHTT